jgi:trk system potassium uptake protein TrkH
LLIAAFILLPLIGALPYFYTDPFNSPTAYDRFTNGYFESVSGFTTTGFSFIAMPETLPTSLLIYRSITELMGGVGVVFLLLVFFQSKQSLNSLGNSLGIDKVNSNIKRTFFSVLGLYGIFILAFTGLFYAIGFHNVITTGTFVIDTITGGFQPSIQGFQPYLSFWPQILIIILMLLGSVNFAFNYHLFTLKPRKAITKEVLLYGAILLLGTVTVAASTNVSVMDSLFHVVSMASSTGQSYLPMSQFGNTGLAILIVLMLIGGCAFSMAGGIRVSKLIAFGRAVKENITNLLVREHVASKQKPEDESCTVDNQSATVAIVLFSIVLIVLAIIFTTSGVSFQDALFEVGSAFTTNGISLGYTTLSMGIGYKWLMIVAMTIGRVEIMSIVIAILSFRKK